LEDLDVTDGHHEKLAESNSAGMIQQGYAISDAAETICSFPSVANPAKTFTGTH